MKIKEYEKKKKRKVIIKKIIAYFLLSIFGFSMVLPLIWMISASLKEPVDVFIQHTPWWRNWIPQHPQWRNYIKVFKAVPFFRFYLNSIFVAIIVTFGQVITSSFSAYAFSRLRFPGRDKLFFGYIATMMVPGTVIIIPVYILMHKFGWINSYKALTIPAMFTAYGTFMLRQFFMTLPRELEDAAKIDGCGFWAIYYKIILPLSRPALATLTTFVFIGNWQSFLWPLLVINSIGKNTLPIGLAYFQSQYVTDWTLLMAASVMAIIPVIIIFVFSQKFFIEGIKLTGIKG
jgi:multiple sugar transport system permease protein